MKKARSAISSSFGACPPLIGQQRHLARVGCCPPSRLTSNAGSQRPVHSATASRNLTRRHQYRRAPVIRHVCRCSRRRRRRLCHATAENRGTTAPASWLPSQSAKEAQTSVRIAANAATQLHAHLTGSISRECLHDIWKTKKAQDAGLLLQDPLVAIPPGKVDYDIKT